MPLFITVTGSREVIETVTGSREVIETVTHQYTEQGNASPVPKPETDVSELHDANCLAPLAAHDRVLATHTLV
jgi:hypothetical protein